MHRFFRNRRGTTALEFSLVALPFLLTLFAIFDVGRYALTIYSLKTLASATARQIIISCYSPSVLSGGSPSSCTADPFTTAQQRAIAPFLYAGGLSPTVTAAVTGSTYLTVTAAEPDFKMLMSVLWGTSLDAPSVSTSIPY